MGNQNANLLTDEPTREELLKGGTAMLLVFAAMYVLVFIEIALSFRWNPNGLILLLYLTRFPPDLAGYYMIITLTAFGMIGAGLCCYGLKWLRRGLKMHGK